MRKFRVAEGLAIRVLGCKIVTFAMIRVWGCLAQRCCGSLIGRRR